MKKGGNDQIAGKTNPFFPLTLFSGVAGFPSASPFLTAIPSCPPLAAAELPAALYVAAEVVACEMADMIRPQQRLA